MDNPLVSVIIPCYNVEKCVSFCLDSVINQTYKNLEIICVNDGSKDGTLDVLKKYAEKDSRIKIISRENKGLAVTRNDGIDAANGEYISFIDSDDFVSLNLYERMLQLMDEYSADIGRFRIRGNITSYDYVEPPLDHEPIIKVRNTLDALKVYYDGVFYGWFADDSSYSVNSIYRKKIFNKVRFVENLYMCEDDCFVQEAIGEADTIVYTDERFYFYYVNPNSIMHNEIPLSKKIELIKMMYKSQQEYFSSKNYEEIRQLNLASACNSFCEFYVKSTETSDKKTSVSEFKKYYKQLNNKSLAFRLFYYSPLLYKLLVKIKYRK